MEFKIFKLPCTIYHQMKITQQNKKLLHLFFFCRRYCFVLPPQTDVTIGVSPSGKASAFGADIRRFESCHPSHSEQRLDFEV